MSGRAQLFVGRLPMDIRERDVEQVFEKYGRLLRCDVKYGMYGSRRGSRTGLAYAFVDYDDRRDAEDAIKYENGREMRGQSIVVEWARGPSYRPGGSSNFQRQSRSSGYQRQRSQTNDECYRCRRQGHWARDCPELERDRYYARRYRSRSRSRSRSHRRKRSCTHSRSRSRDHRRRSPTPERHQKSRSGSRDQRGKQRSPSRSPSKSYSRSRSRSVSKDRKKNDVSVGKGKERSMSKSPSRSRTPSKSRSRSPSYGRKGSSSPRKSPGNDPDYDDKRCENGRGDDIERRSFSGSPRKSVSRSISRERDIDMGSDRSRSQSR